MSTNEVNSEHVEGPRWTVHKRFKTYQEANQFRNGLLIETDDLEVKVHRMGPVSAEFFAVKARIHPDIALEEEAAQRRAAKKARKKKLNKKRRKK